MVAPVRESTRLRTPAVTHSGVLAVAGYRPRTVVDNEKLGARLGVDEEWIESRSGIRERRFAEPDETLASMGRKAAEKALTSAGVSAADVDLVLLASTSNMLQTPPTSVRIAHELGADSAAGIDVSAACAGFCHALAIGSDAIRTGDAGHVLVVGAERMTDIVAPHDRELSFLFADGAGAVVLGPTSRPGVGPVVRGADGAYFDSLAMDGTWGEEDVHGATRPWLRMDGGRVFRWAVREVCEAGRVACERAGLTPAQLDAFVPHQSNTRMIDLMAERLGVGAQTAVARDVVRAGNTSSASIPLALEELLTRRRGASGGAALLVGFGAGLNYAGQVVLLP